MVRAAARAKNLSGLRQDLSIRILSEVIQCTGAFESFLIAVMPNCRAVQIDVTLGIYLSVISHQEGLYPDTYHEIIDVVNTWIVLIDA